MLKLGIGRGYFNHIEYGGRTFTTWYDDTVCPMGSRQYHSEPVMNLPPVDEVYQMMVRLGYSQEEIIDELLAMYHKYRSFKVDYLANSELTLGFIGYRGTGKSASVAKVAIEDFLLAGKKVWSNMNLSVEVVYKEARKAFNSNPLPKLKLLEGAREFQNGLVIFDEVNQEVAEATRYMSKTNLETSNLLQQIRKRGLNVIWSAQNWNTIDARLRWQSDFIVLCSLSKPEHKGVFSHWRIMDATGMSGKLDFDLEMRSHYLLDKIVQQGNVYIRPWWFAYDTHQLQGQGAYNIKDMIKEESDGEGVADSGGSRVPPGIRYAQQYIAAGVEQIYCRDVYEACGCTNNHPMQVQIGYTFNKAGYKRHRDKVGAYWRAED